jgi:CheY-like chemotaxis protein
MPTVSRLCRTALAAAGLPDLVLLDVRLPDGDGLDFCRELKGRHPQVAVLLMTAYARGGLVTEAHARVRGGGLRAQALRPGRAARDRGAAGPAAEGGVGRLARAPRSLTAVTLRGPSHPARPIVCAP